MLANLVLTVISCYLCADFLTGLVHWIEDTYGLPEWPLLGRSVIVPNVDHHRQPGLIARMGTWVSRNLQPVAIAAVGFIVIYCAGVPLLYGALVAAFGAMGNQVHCWSHRKPENNPRFVVWLQSAGFIQSPRQHARHHVAPFDSYFCTLGNAMNEVLEAVRFWRAMEWSISKLGIQPKRGDPRRDGF